MEFFTRVALPLILTSAFVACAAPMPLTYETIAEGVTSAGASEKPILFALRGNDTKANLPAGLPEDARAALDQAIGKSDAALYIVVYAGMQRTGGYRVKINSITAVGDQLVVTFMLEKPAAGQMVMMMLTYPYVIVRVSGTNVAPSKVVFVEKGVAKLAEMK